VYPNGWSAILVSLDNQGMWNLRSAIWDRQYLGQQLYLRVWTPQQSFSNEYSIPTNAILWQGRWSPTLTSKMQRAYAVDS